MNEQIIILFFLIVFLGSTLFLYIWKAKKEIEYKKDERWQMIQIKANKVASYSNNILVIILAVVAMASVHYGIQITFALNRVLMFGIFFIGFYNVIELCALLFLDKRM